MELYECYRLFFLGDGICPEKPGIRLITAGGLRFWLTHGTCIRKPANVGCTAARTDGMAENQLVLLLAGILERRK